MESEVCGDVAVVRVSFGPEVLEETTLKGSLWLLQSSMISQTMSPGAFFFSLLLSPLTPQLMVLQEVFSC